MSYLCKEGALLDESLDRVRRVSRWLAVIFKISLALSCIVGIFLVGLVVLAPILTLQVGFFESILSSLPVVVSYFAFVLILWCLAGSFRDISKGNAPFTRKQGIRIKWIGILLLVYVLMEAFVSANYSNIVQIGNDWTAGFSSSASATPSLIHVDAKAIVGSIVCFALSMIFSYGSLLQELKDETV